MKRLQSTLTLISVLAGVPLLAQSTPKFQGDQHWAPWPASKNAPGAFGKGVPAQLTPDGVMDVLQLDGSQLVLLTNPDELFSVTNVRAGVEDMSTLRGAGAGGLDAVAIVGAGGLERVWYDSALGAFASASIDANTWAGAGLVRAADLDADGVSDLIGVASDRQSILVQLADSSGTAFHAASGFVVQADVLDVRVLQWDTDGAPEVALLTDLGVEVRDLDGGLLDSFPAAIPGGAICVIGQAGEQQDRLAWITEYAPPALQYLLVLCASAGVTEIVDLGALDAFATVSADYDLDGDDDILISHRFSYELLWIENERTQQTPSGTSFYQAGDRKVFSVDSQSSASQNEAWPVVADLDGDGDQDVAFASEGTSKLVVFRGEALDQDALRASVESASYSVDFLGGDGVLDLVLGAPSSIPAGATHLELRVWRQAYSGALLDEEPLEFQTLPLSGGWPSAAAIALPEQDAAFQDNYCVHLRLVGLGAGPLATYPSSVGVFGLLAADRGALATEPATLTDFDVTIPVPLEPEQSPNFTSVRRLKIPPPPASKIPKF